MGRKFISKVALVFLVAIIILFILGKNTTILIGDFTPLSMAGIFSVVIGAFSFIQQKILAKKTKITHFLFQLLMIVLGVTILSEQVYTYLKSQNTLLDGIIIGLYVLLLFSCAYATRNEHVEKSEISQAERMLGTSKKSKKKNEDVNMDELRKMMKKNS